MIIGMISAFFAGALCVCVGIVALHALGSPRRVAPSVDRIASLLPNIDCRACGFDSCVSFAAGILEKRADPEGCAALSDGATAALHAELRDKGRARHPDMTAFVACGAVETDRTPAFGYAGYRDCVAAHSLFSGPYECKNACLGFGSCVKFCPRGAIRVEDGLARIDRARCNACGECVAACPTQAIKMVERDQPCQIACNSRDNGKRKAAICAVSCTACMKCDQLSTNAEFSVRENLAQAGSPHPGNWKAIAASCPTGAIRLNPGSSAINKNDG